MLRFRCMGGTSRDLRVCFATRRVSLTRKKNSDLNQMAKLAVVDQVQTTLSKAEGLINLTDVIICLQRQFT